MPLYEYKCDKCEQTFEVIQKFSDEPLTVHDKCGGAVRRLLSSPALQFKGSGWYVNDYAKSGRSTPKSDAAGESKSDSKSESTSESKSESTSKSSETKTSDAPKNTSKSTKKD